MCTAAQSFGVSHSFIEFNLPPDLIFPSINDCACKILTASCHASIDITYLSLDFDRPASLSGYTNCSGSSLYEERFGRKYNCSNEVSGIFTIKVPSSDVISVNDLFAQGPNDKPTYILILVKGTYCF